MQEQAEIKGQGPDSGTQTPEQTVVVPRVGIKAVGQLLEFKGVVYKVAAIKRGGRVALKEVKGATVKRRGESS